MSEPATSASLLTTLIQVGVPSAVTIVSLAFTYIATKAGHKKDITIAELTLRGKLRVDNSERRASLVREVAEIVSNVENAIGRHSGVFRRDSNDFDSYLTAGAKAELVPAFADLSQAIDSCCGARGKINLLGEPEISDHFELFLQDLFKFQREANPAANVGALELSEALEPALKRRASLMHTLSALYLKESAKNEP